MSVSSDPSAYPPVYVINLPRSKARKYSIVSQFKKLGIPYRLVTAVEGSAMSPDVIARYNRIKKQEEVKQELSYSLPRDLLPGEVGCYLSHIGIYKEIRAKRLPWTIILEDDVLLPAQFGDLICHIAQRKLFYDIIFLGDLYFDTRSFVDSGAPLSLWGRRTLMPPYQLGRFMFLPLGSHAYALSYAGARKLLTIAEPMLVPLDLLLTSRGKNIQMNFAGLSPRPIEVIPRFFESTTIANRPTGYQRAGWKNYLAARSAHLYNAARLTYRFFCRVLIFIYQLLPPAFIGGGGGGGHGK